MIPTSTTRHLCYRVGANSKFLSKRLAGGSARCPYGSNFNHSRGCEFGSRVLLSTSHKRKSSFVDTILSVFLFGSNPKMFKIDAGRVVASGTIVQDAQPFWYRPLVQNPRGDARTNGFFEWSASGNRPITFNFTPSPEPAGIGLVHLGPEALWKILTQMLRSKVLRGNLDHTSSVFAARGYWPWAASSFCQGCA